MKRLSRAISCVFLAWTLTGGADAAESVSIYALFNGKAILMVDGNRRVLNEGEVSPEGVRLISASIQDEQVVIERDGKRVTIQHGVVIAPITRETLASTTLWKGDGEFFHADGSINNTTVTFLVDTGANTIAMNSATARRVGLDYKKGQRGIATTASGYTPMYRVVLNTVKVGEIVLHNVAAGVIEGPQPDQPLLGMSFLGQLEMRRDGDKMELIKKY
jgi:aspartyl protease family protein